MPVHTICMMVFASILGFILGFVISRRYEKAKHCSVAEQSKLYVLNVVIILVLVLTLLWVVVVSSLLIG